MSSPAEILKAHANQLGFMACRVAKAEFLEEEAPRLDAWLGNGFQGSMAYMNNHHDKRLDPRLLVPGAKSVITLAYNYFPEKDEAEDDHPKMAKYAYGMDYHRVVKDKLFELMHLLQADLGQIGGRCFVDSAPVMERAWAKRSGLGWVGKHGLILRKGEGSFFFLAELIVDMAFTVDQPVMDHCGTCTKCIDVCPTQAIIAPEVVDANKCISHLTIELKGAMDDAFQGQLKDWVFGCDICQDVCPWNSHSKPHDEPDFMPGKWTEMDLKDWTSMSKEAFDRVFDQHPLKRTGYDGLMRNLKVNGFKA